MNGIIRKEFQQELKVFFVGGTPMISIRTDERRSVREEALAYTILEGSKFRKVIEFTPSVGAVTWYVTGKSSIYHPNSEDDTGLSVNRRIDRSAFKMVAEQNGCISAEEQQEFLRQEVKQGNIILSGEKEVEEQFDFDGDITQTEVDVATQEMISMIDNQLVSNGTLPASDKMKAIVIMNDVNTVMNEEYDMLVCSVRTLANKLRLDYNFVLMVIHSRKWEVPSELRDNLAYLAYKPPSQKEREEIVRGAINIVTQSPAASKYPNLANKSDEEIREIARAIGGFNYATAEDTLLRSVAQELDMTPHYINKAKADRVKLEDGYIVINPTYGFENVGGLDRLKDEIELLRGRFGPEAEEYGFPKKPVGCLLAGVPGSGKSLTVTAIGYTLGIPVLQVRPTDLKGGIVGQSEEKTAKILERAKAMSPCVLWFDELDKMMGQSDRVSDGGAHDGMLGTFLTFMQEEASKYGVYIVATANHTEKLPAELLRRFDLRVFIDVPKFEGRKSIFEIHLSKFKRDTADFDIDALAKKTDGYTGYDIEIAVGKAASKAFADRDESGVPRAFNTEDVIEAIESIPPSINLNRTKIEQMREIKASGGVISADYETSDKKKSTSKVETVTHARTFDFGEVA